MLGLGCPKQTFAKIATPRDLLAPELFGYGGEAFGRGYDPSEAVGDHGLAAKLELRFSNHLPFSTPQPYTLYGYVDAGRVWQRNETPLDDDTTITSAGLGLRLSLFGHVSAAVELAQPISHPVAAEGSDDARAYFTLSARF